ncbi:hypothetical protein PGT21_022654 [Puccinia graminis f. sp. tritici]|uniref:Uncharacterized protein n=1 Tax=Puccinia graminis f. sp. tritici TaxID=56615 RepID=A0A5B0NGZ9_PUCGR|nr:hypothetical protein PGT21_022654 [Puccinia graminis f. sp. tritici]
MPRGCMSTDPNVEFLLVNEESTPAFNSAFYCILMRLLTPASMLESELAIHPASEGLIVTQAIAFRSL